MSWALIVDGVVREVTQQDPTGRFFPGLNWIAAPEGTLIDYTYDGAHFARPSPDVAPTPTLTDRRAALAAERYVKQSGGVMFKASGASAPSLAATDVASTGLMTSSYVAAAGGHWVDGTPWKMVDGTFEPFTSADMQAMALKALGYIAACYAHEAELSAALATDLTTDITAGWPANT